MEDVVKDFETMPLDDIKRITTNKGNIRIGKLPDGKIVNMRKHSNDGRPTLEIRHGKNSIKIRYGSKIESI